ncbi:unnamed protein product, partial [Rotaria sp. Silwood1]
MNIKNARVFALTLSINRFSKDQQVVDELLPATFFDTIQILLMVLGS